MTTTSSDTLFDVLMFQQGFRAIGSGLIGTLAGVPLRVDQARGERNTRVLRLWLGLASPASVGAVRDALLADRGSLPIKLRAVTAADRGVAVDLPAKVAKAPAAESFAAVEAIAQRTAAVSGGTPTPDGEAHLATVDGFPRWLTASEREALATEGQMVGQSSAAIPTRLGLGLAAGALGALITAVAWALLSAYAERQEAYVAIVGGLLISFLVRTAARRVTVPLQVGVFVLTLVGVAFGEILGLALWVNRTFGGFDLARAFEGYIALLGDGLAGDALFALGGGLIGAFFGIGAASRSTFDGEIEMR